MVIEGGCGPVKVRSEGGRFERKKDRNREELLERAGFHSAVKHVHFSRNPLSVNLGL